ncbi:MAG: hypothetical protein GYB65_20505 [Chloroflexi bacterium]|nr:hypothetical protein [Chloroflexota bacterium]
MRKIEVILAGVIVLLLVIIGVLVWQRTQSDEDDASFSVTISGARADSFTSGEVFYEFVDEYFLDEKQWTHPDTTMLTIQNGSGDTLQVISINIPVDVEPGTYALQTPVDLSTLPVGATVPVDEFTASYYAPDGASYIADVTGLITLTETGDRISGEFAFEASPFDAYGSRANDPTIQVEGTFEGVSLRR